MTSGGRLPVDTRPAQADNACRRRCEPSVFLSLVVTLIVLMGPLIGMALHGAVFTR